MLSRSTIRVRKTPFLVRSSHVLRHTAVFLIVHIGAIAVLWTGGTPLQWALVLPIATVRGLLVTIGYHRYFAHRSFKTSRAAQFLLAFLCCMNLQNGPLWWAVVHRHHHRFSDRPEDYHSPVQGGFWYGHFGWLFVRTESPSLKLIGDLTRFPELVWLERLWILPGLAGALLCWLLGGLSCVCVDFFFTAFLTLQMTFVVNSVSHLVGSRRYETNDSSRNSFLLALVTLGDGWHNNHHHYPHAAQAGFQWWEVDLSFRVIQLFARLGVVWDIRTVPPHKVNRPAVKAPTMADDLVDGSTVLGRPASI